MKDILRYCHSRAWMHRHAGQKGLFLHVIATNSMCCRSRPFQIKTAAGSYSGSDLKLCALHPGKASRSGAALAVWRSESNAIIMMQ